MEIMSNKDLENLFYGHLIELKEKLNLVNSNSERFNYLLDTLMYSQSKLITKLVEKTFEQKYKDSDFQNIPYQNKSWAISYISHQDFIKRNIEGILSELYGTCCCVDKSNFLFSSFFKEYFLNKKVSFNKSEYEYSYQIPETCKKESWMNLVEGIMLLENGKNQKYIDAVLAIKKEHSLIINSKDYIINKIKEELFYLLNEDKSHSLSDNILDLVPHEKFPNREAFCKEIIFNKFLIKNIYQLFLQNEDLKIIKEEILKIKTELTFPEHPRMTNGEKWRLQELYDKGEIYEPFLDLFHNYQYIYHLKSKLINKLDKIIYIEDDKLC